tara:strand:- start:887 stop:1093 length:207 start_codon:yes stop_codon:yes gene_type:complete
MSYEGNIGLVAKGTSFYDEADTLYLWRKSDFNYEISGRYSEDYLKDIPYPQALRRFKQQLKYGTFEEL